jgi:hypothetical protein
MNMRNSRYLIPLLLLAAPAVAGAQQGGGLTAAAGAGGTFYCVVTRCNTGLTAGGGLAWEVLPVLAFEAGARRQFCFDCDRYIIADGGAQLRLPGRVVQPFLAGGASFHSDPEFIGENMIGPYAGAGLWVFPRGGWGARVELRGHRLDPGDHVGELSVAIARRAAGGR